MLSLLLAFPSLPSSLWAPSRRLAFWWLAGGISMGSLLPFPPQTSLPHYSLIYTSRSLPRFFSGSVNLVNKAWESEKLQYCNYE